MYTLRSVSVRFFKGDDKTDSLGVATRTFEFHKLADIENLKKTIAVHSIKDQIGEKDERTDFEKMIVGRNFTLFHPVRSDPNRSSNKSTRFFKGSDTSDNRPLFPSDWDEEITFVGCCVYDSGQIKADLSNLAESSSSASMTAK